MTVKADAHYLDCDIKPLTPEDWTSPPSVVTSVKFNIAVVTENTRFFILDSDYQSTLVTPTRNDGGPVVGCQSVAFNLDGNFVVGYQPVNDGPAIQMFDTDGNVIGPTFEWEFGVEGNGYLQDLTFSKDGNYIYAAQGITTSRIFKWDVSTGDQIWRKDSVGLPVTIMHPHYDDRIISFRYPFSGVGGLSFLEGWRPAVFDENGNIDNYWSMSFWGSSGNLAIPARPSATVCSTKNAYIACLQTGDHFCIARLSLTDFDDYDTWSLETGADCYAICLYGDYLYALVVDSAPHAFVYKFNAADLTVDSFVNLTSPLIVTQSKDMWLDYLGRIALKSRDPALSNRGVVLLDSDDLSIIDSIDTGLSSWTSQLIFDAHSLPNAFEHTFGPTTGAPTSQQDRTVAYPANWLHLEGETVQVLGDGIFLGTEIVSGGQIDLDDNTTNNHVGLRFDSKVQPMKIDGEAQVKRISKLIPDVFESVGGDYGESEDDLYTMVLRTTNDPMDIDGELHTGYIELPFKGRYDRQADIFIVQNEPLPMHLLGLGVNLSVEAI